MPVEDAEVYLTQVRESADVLVIGGGFFGLYLSEYLRKTYPKVILCEAENALMAKASLRNQARVHNGYHYPRSILTGIRCRINFQRFNDEFSDCVDLGYQSHYAVARIGSHVTARQFELFCERIGAPLRPAKAKIKKLFDPVLIEDVFEVDEFVFDSSKVRDTMVSRVHHAGVDVRLATNAVSLKSIGQDGMRVTLRDAGSEYEVDAGMVINCTYSSLNEMLASSGLPLIPLKHELAEMALVEIPEPWREVYVTVMCGPYFSLMRFPTRKLHTLSHVRYTPHWSWQDKATDFTPTREMFKWATKKTNFPHMVRDSARYLPFLSQCQYVDSLWEVKTVLPMTETDDSRPILFLKHHGLPNHHLILGAKIDNVYDVLLEFEAMLGSRSASAVGV